MRFVETIKILDGQPLRLELHNDRCNKTRFEHFHSSDKIDLRSSINLPLDMQSGLVKCRVVYQSAVHEVSYHHYKPKQIKSLKTVYDNDVFYSYKDTLRPSLDALYAFRESHDEIIIVKNGLITDAYYYNVALRKNDLWYTPKAPLLQGVMRQSLLNDGHLIEADIRADMIKEYDQICLFNALNEFGEVVVPIENIL